MIRIILVLLFFYSGLVSAQVKNNFVKENFIKIDTNIVMRDGIKLKTIIYVPKDETEKYPFLIERTPYSSGP